MVANAVTQTRPANLAVFDEVRAGIALYKKENASMVFNYEDPIGEKEARSHIYKLRQAKSKVVAIHKDAKAEALAICRAIDAEKNMLIEDVEEMIDVHMGPIKAIEDRKQKEIEAKEEAERLEKERIEQERLDAIKKQEDEIARKQAEIKAEEDRLVREREILEAEKRAEAEAKRREEEVRKQAEIDKREALERAEREKQEAIEAEREKARKEAEAKAKAEAERVAAEKAEQERLAEIERKRQANKKHREKIDKEVIGIFTDFKMPSDKASKLAAEISKGLYPALTINY